MNPKTDFDIQTLSLGDSKFSTKLQLIKPKIKQIQYIGDINLLFQPILGIVGPRKSTDYGVQVLHKLFEKAKSYRMVTISGMAEGIDQLCHNLSIQHKIPTIAVLG
ncbi:DNA-protecting protein DprA [Patescibacteria group bacterium]|nr:DNA-protecting protein DprA [Patescibacteria group bacterium]